MGHRCGQSPAMVIAALVWLFSPATQAYELQWLVTLGGARGDSATATTVDEQGNVIAVGKFEDAVDFDPGPDTLQLVAQGLWDAFVIKLDGKGQLEWAGQFGGPERENPSAVAVGPDGSVYVGGHFDSTADFDPGPGTMNLAATGGFDPFVVKLDPQGNLVWARVFNGSGFVHTKDLAVDAGGNVVVIGTMTGTTDFDPGPGVFELSGDASFFVKLDGNGDLVWATNLSTGWIRVKSLALDGSGSLHATGLFSAGADFDPGPGVVTLPGSCAEVFVLKLDANASFVWVKGTRGPPCGDTGGNNAVSVAVDTQGGVITTGVFQNTTDFDPGPGNHSVNTIAQSTFVWKLDASGEFVWVRTPEPQSEDSHQHPTALLLDGCDGILVAGSFSGQVDFDPGSGEQLLSGVASPFFWNLTSEGEWDGSVAFDAPPNGTNFHDLARGPGGRFAGAGSFNGTTDFDPGDATAEATPIGSADLFVLEFARALTLTVTRDSLEWAGPHCPLGYDLILGDLGVLRQSGGDFQQATEACLLDDGLSTGAPFAVDPGSGEGFWFLVREFGGSYDSAGTGQVQSRDASIAASGVACP